MVAFVIELGQTSGEGEYKRWESRGYYQNYAVAGPIVVDSIGDAFRFPTHEMASRLPAGDVRLQAHRIVRVDGEPTR